MRLACKLRDFRAELPRLNGKPVSLSDIARATGISGGVLSGIERGVFLPTDTQVPILAEAYEHPPWEWYPAQTLLVIQADEEAV